MHRRALWSPLNTASMRDFNRRRNGAAANMCEVARSRARLRHPLCSDEPFDIRDPQLDGLQRQVRGARRREPVRHVDAQRVDITQPALDGRLAFANDRLDRRRQSRCRRARPRDKPPRIGYRIGSDSQPCGQAPVPGALLDVAGGLDGFQYRLARRRAASAKAASARARSRKQHNVADCRGRTLRNTPRGRCARHRSVAPGRSVQGRDTPSPRAHASAARAR